MYNLASLSLEIIIQLFSSYFCFSFLLLLAAMINLRFFYGLLESLFWRINANLSAGGCSHPSLLDTYCLFMSSLWWHGQTYTSSSTLFFGPFVLVPQSSIVWMILQEEGWSRCLFFRRDFCQNDWFRDAYSFVCLFVCLFNCFLGTPFYFYF